MRASRYRAPRVMNMHSEVCKRWPPLGKQGDPEAASFRRRIWRDTCIKTRICCRTPETLLSKSVSIPFFSLHLNSLCRAQASAPLGGHPFSYSDAAPIPLTRETQVTAPRLSRLRAAPLQTGQVLTTCPDWVPTETVRQVSVCRTQDQPRQGRDRSRCAPRRWHRV